MNSILYQAPKNLDGVERRETMRTRIKRFVQITVESMGGRIKAQRDDDGRISLAGPAFWSGKTSISTTDLQQCIDVLVEMRDELEQERENDKAVVRPTPERPSYMRNGIPEAVIKKGTWIANNLRKHFLATSIDKGGYLKWDVFSFPTGLPDVEFVGNSLLEDFEKTRHKAVHESTASGSQNPGTSTPPVVTEEPVSTASTTPGTVTAAAVDAAINENLDTDDDFPQETIELARSMGA
jgi:hypothetical protein